MNKMSDESESSDEDIALSELKEKKKSAKKKKAVAAVKPDPAPNSSKKRKSATATTNGSAKNKKAKVSNGDTNQKAKVKKEANGDKKPKALKKLDKTERLQYGMQSFLWWNAAEPPLGCQWDTMEHAGVAFPEPYVPHGVKMLYDGQPVDFTPVQEEAYVQYMCNVRCQFCRQK
jgi:DNA topoisomerase-1